MSADPHLDLHHVQTLRRMAGHYEAAQLPGLARLLYDVAQLIELRETMTASARTAADEAVDDIARASYTEKR